MYKGKTEEHKGKNEFLEIEDISKGEEPRVEGNEMPKENQQMEP